MNLAVWYGASDKIAEKKPEEIMRDILHEDVERNVRLPLTNLP